MVSDRRCSFIKAIISFAVVDGSFISSVTLPDFDGQKIKTVSVLFKMFWSGLG